MARVSAHYALQMQPHLEAAALRARDSLVEFLKFMHPDPEFPLDPSKTRYMVKPHHRMLCHFFERFEALDHLKIAGSVGPQFGKSTIISENGVAWLIGRNPDKHVISASYGTNLARKTGRRVRDIIQSERYKMVFPDVVLDKSSRSAQEMKIANFGGTLYFPSVNSPTTGFPADYFIIDDPYKDKASTYSDVKRQNVLDWYNAVVSARCKNWTAQFVFHTRWHFDDLQGVLTDVSHPSNAGNADKIADCRKWLTFNIPAIIDTDEMSKMLRIPVGAPIWPEYHSLEKLETIRRRAPSEFNALYMGRPVPESGDLFTRDLFRMRSLRQFPPRKNLRIYAGLDLAASQSKRADFSVLTFWGMSPDGRIYVLDVLRWKERSDRLVEKILDACDKYRPIKIYAEKGQLASSIWGFLAKRMGERGGRYSFETRHNSTDKVLRAQATIALMGDGRLIFPEDAPWFAMVQQQFLQFPSGVNDDIVDSFSEIAGRIYSMISGDAPPDASDTPDDDGIVIYKPLTYGDLKAIRAKEDAFMSAQRASRRY